MIRLEDLNVGARVNGLVPGQAVTVVTVEPIGPDAANVIYRDDAGKTSERMVFRSDEASLELVTEGRPWSFDGDADTFKLAAEAHRIQLAHLFDPLMAVHTSNVIPLPHQITAVYEAMLPRQPLRFLLADDPGAGKTIMAGLLIKELMVRGDVKRCLVVAPGSLVEQWQDELDQKFGLIFELFTRQMIETSPSGNPFAEHDLLVARLDQLARADDLREKLKTTEWDLVIVDEAHKMSVSFFGAEMRKTKRYELGELLGRITRHFLLMTATPHNGNEESFQGFLALLDSDRFYGKFRDGVHQVDVSDVMRRMVKEDLVRFDGTKLFPPRFAYTANYELSDAEAALYEAVTQYVREEMNKADQLDGKRRGTVGFALTVLQRRLASSPEAIYQSLRRRRQRLEQRIEEEKLAKPGATALSAMEGMANGFDDQEFDPLEDVPPDELEELEEQVVDQATAARTIAQLEEEVEHLRRLEAQARDLRLSGQDRKWEELSRILQDEPEMRDAHGHRRKLIVFTEHRDTLNYLVDRIRGLLGNPDAVVMIHGGVHREERRKIQERFTQDKDVLILVATDAAGEGINLQRANLLINYDLPWNPNRLEQRFGRIHRIGQTEVCHMWNLVAKGTREGDVFQRLFEKVERERQALGGRVFDILGAAFEGEPLKKLLLDAIRYGEDPEVRAKIFEKVEGALDTEHLKAILARNALAEETLSADRLYRVREEMAKAEARKLQPHFIRSFFRKAFATLGGDLKEREPGRYEITYVPQAIRARDRVIGTRQPVLPKYERICFEREKIRHPGRPPAALVCPGHPLLDAIIDLILERHRDLLKRGAILVDPADEGTDPRVLFIIDHAIRDAGTDASGHPRVISQRMQFVHVDRQGRITQGGYAPYLDYRPAEPHELQMVADLLDEPWIRRDLEQMALAHAVSTLVPEHLSEVKERRERQVDRILRAVNERLVKEINYWTHRAAELQLQVNAGKQPRMQPENARRRAEELSVRLKQRIQELEAQRHVVSAKPHVVGGALVIPQGLLDLRAGRPVPEWARDAEARARIERAAMEAVLEAERTLGNVPEDVSAQKYGWDITSRTPDGDVRLIEVKGRVNGATTITVTKNEILTCLNQPERFYLAVVLVGDGAAGGTTVDGPYYLKAPFKQELDFGVVSQNYDLKELLGQAERVG